MNVSWKMGINKLFLFCTLLGHNQEPAGAVEYDRRKFRKVPEKKIFLYRRYMRRLI